MSEPRTKAGRALLAYDLDTDTAAINDVLGKRHWVMRDAILAIEAEAAAPYLGLVDAAQEWRQETPALGCDGSCNGLASPGPCGACATVDDYLRQALAALKAEALPDSEGGTR